MPRVLGARSGGASSGLVRITGKTLPPAIVLTLLIGVGWDKAAALDLAVLGERLAAASALAIAAAIALTALSYAAVALYDVIAFRLIGRRAPLTALLRSGVAATGLGQALGFGMVVGGYARWRILRAHGVGPAEAAGASALITTGFFLGLAVVMAVVAILASPSVAALMGVGEADVIAGGLLALILFLFLIHAAEKAGSIRVFRRRLTLPSPRIALWQAGLAALDALPAGLALWLLLPAEAEAGLGLILIAYLFALTAGLLSNTPGGVGVFEAVILLALPAAPVESVLAGLILFRIVYYGLPFLVGAGLLAEAEMRAARSKSAVEQTPPTAEIEAAMRDSDRAEANLAHLPGKRFVFSPDRRAFIMFGETRKALVAMGDPVGPRDAWPALIAVFLMDAKARGKRPVFYKTGDATAALLRASGLRTDRIGHEAVVDVASFSLSGSKRRELRRKVKKAEKAGVEIRIHAPGEAPMAALDAVAEAWRAAKKGRERTFSTGHYDPAYLARFPILSAMIDGVPVAFISLWKSGDGSEWALDLMRVRPGAPDGVMHALATAAIELAGAAGAKHFNLCMAPLSGLDAAETPVERAAAAFYAKGDRLHHLKGLHRFKQSFRPDWRPRYLARRRGPAVIGAVTSIRRLVSQPTPAMQAA